MLRDNASTILSSNKYAVKLLRITALFNAFVMSDHPNFTAESVVNVSLDAYAAVPVAGRKNYPKNTSINYMKAASTQPFTA